VNLLYDDVEKHYHEITHLTGAMAKKLYVRRATNVVGVTRRRYAIRRVATVRQDRLALSELFEFPARNAIETLGRACFDNHKRPKAKKRSV